MENKDKSVWVLTCRCDEEDHVSGVYDSIPALMADFAGSVATAYVSEHARDGKTSVELAREIGELLAKTIPALIERVEGPETVPWAEDECRVGDGVYGVEHFPLISEKGKNDDGQRD
jgi:hypothetical protein